MSSAPQQVHLWLEHMPTRGDGSSVNAPDACQPLALPFKSARLPLDPQPPVDSTPMRPNGDAGVITEPFFNQQRQLRLLVTFPSEVTPVVNGEKSLHRVVLQSGDVFQWTANVAFHVTLFNKPRIGPPSSEQLTKPCPVCRVPLSRETTCYACPCGAAIHCEADESNGLQCAQLSTECPRCTKPIILKEGYSYTPSHE